ncbi:MAG TPA: AraC family transcriptional regulator [Bryobacteraceae bacterium]|nr:AraC family transcriptional regulator [Bryobacteraceae bacterium]
MRAVIRRPVEDSCRIIFHRLYALLHHGAYCRSGRVRQKVCDPDDFGTAAGVREDLTGTTPHQYLLRMRLRRAALRLRTARSKVLDVALECGFGDVSNFLRAFRGEFGVSPRVYRS